MKQTISVPETAQSSCHSEPSQQLLYSNHVTNSDVSHTRKLSDEQVAILRLSAVKGVGLRRFHALYERFGNAQSVLEASYDTLIDVGLAASLAREITSMSASNLSEQVAMRLQQVQAWLNESPDYHHVISMSDHLYPEKLRQIHNCPPLLYLKGRVNLLDMPSIAIVGSRKASIAGMRIASDFAKELALYGVNVLSGMALGVDTHAHKGALDVEGMTTAVLGTGIDIVYPRQNTSLAEQLSERCAIVSEMPLGTMPVPANFPRRNRLVSGLSDGVLVVEATEKSGSLITANFALEQNRDVFAIPGPIDSLNHTGSNNLIKQGAQLVTHPDEIIEALRLKLPSAKQTLADSAPPDNEPGRSAGSVNFVGECLSSEEMQIYTLVSHSTTSFDFIISQISIDVPSALQLLMQLELKGIIATVPGGYQRIKAVNSASSCENASP